MHPIVKNFGKVLRLVGISSPEDATQKAINAGDPPSWRSEATKSKIAERETKQESREVE